MDFSVEQLSKLSSSLDTLATTLRELDAELWAATDRLEEFDYLVYCDFANSVIDIHAQALEKILANFVIAKDATLLTMQSLKISDNYIALFDSQSETWRAEIESLTRKAHFTRAQTLGANPIIPDNTSTVYQAYGQYLSTAARYGHSRTSGDGYELSTPMISFLNCTLDTLHELGAGFNEQAKAMGLRVSQRQDKLSLEKERGGVHRTPVDEDALCSRSAPSLPSLKHIPEPPQQTMAPLSSPPQSRTYESPLKKLEQVSSNIGLLKTAAAVASSIAEIDIPAIAETTPKLLSMLGERLGFSEQAGFTKSIAPRLVSSATKLSEGLECIENTAELVDLAPVAKLSLALIMSRGLKTSGYSIPDKIVRAAKTAESLSRIISGASLLMAPANPLSFVKGITEIGGATIDLSKRLARYTQTEAFSNKLKTNSTVRAALSKPLDGLKALDDYYTSIEEHDAESMLSEPSLPKGFAGVLVKIDKALKWANEVTDIFE